MSTYVPFGVAGYSSWANAGVNAKSERTAQTGLIIGLIPMLILVTSYRETERSTYFSHARQVSRALTDAESIVAAMTALSGKIGLPPPVRL